MTPLRVAFFVKPSPSSMLREERNMGLFSYDVPEFVWTHFPHNNERVNMRDFAEYDVVFHEDSGFVTYDHKGSGPPIVYYAIDSTLTDAHLQKRIHHARQAEPLSRGRRQGATVAILRQRSPVQAARQERGCGVPLRGGRK